MRLLVVRHAIAEDREAFARSHKDDATRPLTPDGRRKMERAALGLKELVPELDVLAASPYKRAIETAEIISAAFGGLSVERVPDLAPGAGVDRVVSWLADRHARGSVAVVGHEPDLGQLVCALLASTNGPFLELRKGAACLLELAGPVTRGAATLDWFLGPKHLRLLGTGRD
ncbi:MAG: phosphohistidine phosphatase [Gemmatimonadetes bacterium]|jgi:phosphohistidine phosphatase|nr:MAG: phosphohistidine phosphatase [Gemmatimonadota bacterium]